MSNSHAGPSTPSLRSSAGAIVTILLCAVFLRSSDVADAQPPRVLDPFMVTTDVSLLRAEAERQGTLRVIVGVQTGGQGMKSLEALTGQHSPAADTEREQIVRTAQARVLADLSAAGAAAVPYVLFDYIPFMALEVDARALDALARNRFVTSIENDALSHVDMDSSAAVIGASGDGGAWAKGYTGTGYAVAVLDTGVDKAHPHLSTRVVSEACYNIVASGVTSRCPGGALSSTASGSGADCVVAFAAGCGHGTHVAGTVASTDATYRGIAYDAQIIAINVFSLFPAPTDPEDPTESCDSYGSQCVLANVSNQIQGLERVYALHNDFNIAAVNMSLGGGQYFSEDFCDTSNASRKAAITNLRNVNIATVASAGNSGYVNAMGAPGCLSVAIGVGATTDADAVSGFSNSADFLDVFAPGEYIMAAQAGTTSTIIKHGTSMATPHIAGALAVLRQANPNADVATLLSVIQSTGISITDTRLGAGGRVKPRIRLSHAIDALVVPAAPTGLSAAAVGQTQIDLSWDNVERETGYAIERSPDGSSNWTPLTSTAADVTTYSDTTVACGTTYHYRVSAVNAGGSSVPSSIAQAVTAICPPAKPSNITATAVSQTQIDLLWNDVASESGYTVEHSPDGATGWADIGTNTADDTSFSHTGLSCGTTHHYRVTAGNTSGSSAASDVAAAATVVCTPAQPAGLSATENGQTRIDLIWSDAAGETAYVIERSLNGGADWADLETIGADVTAYSDTTLSCDMTAHYRVSASNAGGTSAPSDAASATTGICAPAQPAGLAAEATGETQIDLIWTDVVTEASYRIERSADGSTMWVVIGTNTADDTTFSDTTLSCGVTRYYRIVAINGGGDSTPSTLASATTQICLPTQPSGLNAVPVGQSQIDLSWTDGSYEDSFRIEHSDDGTIGWVPLEQNAAGDTTFSHTGLACDTAHHYRVVAVNTRGESAASDVVTATTMSCSVTSELLDNGDFELDTDGNTIPDGWKGKKLAGDTLKCKPEKAYSGSCAFVMKGSATENAKLVQDVDLAGVTLLAGDTLTFSVVSKGDNAALSAKLVLKIKLVGKKKATVLKASLPRHAVYAPVSTAAYVVGTTPVQSVTVSVAHKSKRSKVWLDSARLLLTTDSSRDTTTAVLLLPLP